MIARSFTLQFQLGHAKQNGQTILSGVHNAAFGLCDFESIGGMN
jgi:hypothetical protein